MPRFAFSEGEANIESIVSFIRLENCCENASWPAAEERIVRELSLSNLNVTLLDGHQILHGHQLDDESIKLALASALDKTKSRVSFLIFVTPEANVQLFTLFRNPNTSNEEYHQLFLGKRSSDDTAEVIALKAKEAVHATLYDVQNQSLKKSASKELSHNESSDLSQAALDFAQKKRATSVTITDGLLRGHQWVQVRADFGASWSPGGVGAMGVLGGGLSVRAPHNFSFGAGGWVSVLNKEIKSDTANASVRLIVARFRASYIFRTMGFFLPSIGVRLGIGHLRSKGASDINPVKTASTTFFHSGIFGQVDIFRTNRITIPVSLGVGFLFPGVAVRFAGETQATLGAIIVESSIGIAVII